MTSELTQALLTCPFCGGVAMLDNQSGDFARCYCATCDAQGEECDTEAEAIAAWNTRLTAPSGEGRSGAGPHNVDANGKPTDDSDPWFQFGWYKDRLERAETERDIWKERAMSLRIASRKAGLLQTALEDICDPIAALCRYADERGRQLDGAVAFQLANDPNHIKGIARAALRATDDAGGAK